MLSCFGAARPKKDEPFIYLRATDTLYIEVMDSLYMNGMGETDRFHRIEKAIEDIFEEINFPLAYEIERFGSQRTPANQPRLSVTIMKWGDNGLNEVEARFSASIRRDFDRNKLGVYFMRGPNVFGGTERVIRAHNEVMEKAIAEMVKELKSRLSVDLPSDGKPALDGEDDIPESN